MKQLNNSKIKKNNGFSLIEVIVMITVLGIIGYILVDLLDKGFTGNDKTRLLGSVQQNGQVVSNSIGETIRLSTGIVCTDTTSTTNPFTATMLGIENQDGTYTRFMFKAPTAAANGYIIKQVFPPISTVESDPENLLKNKNNLAVLCDLSIFNETRKQSIVTDTNPVSGISIENGQFIIDRSAGFEDIVTIQFDVKQGVTALSGFENELASPQTFRTTVQVR